MQKVSTKELHPAILDAAKSGSNYRIIWQQILVQVRFTWPKHTAKKLQDITGTSERTSYRWLAEKTEPNSIETIAILSALRDEHSKRGRLFEQFEMFVSK